MAHKKGVGSSKNGRESQSKRKGCNQTDCIPFFLSAKISKFLFCNTFDLHYLCPHKSGIS